MSEKFKYLLLVTCINEKFKARYKRHTFDFKRHYGNNCLWKLQWNKSFEFLFYLFLIFSLQLSIKILRDTLTFLDLKLWRNKVFFANIYFVVREIFRNGVIELTDTLVCGLDGVRCIGRYCLRDRDPVIHVATLEGKGSVACAAL